MKRLALLCLGVAICAPGLAQAQRVSPMKAGNFARICARATGHSVCDAYLSGLADGVSLSKISARNEGDANAPAGFCVPVQETTDAMRAKVLTWLKAHTDALNKPVGESIFTALHDSYPCSAKQ
ncbi:Rap1a/Tai family immunity protein [Acetobacter vaccinii]|mgnify:FL=1|uniref:Rap1a immunity protein domain-containing protein n=1 Tax=Acetobacter vaccinii TaxID=2592655 RepID=A0A5C1YSU1_9PROT|nr:Rap1a/Tai family immunity protein [Acetobacter vaccinii]QEO18319.1 hypothetical protein FLP30_11840 [Acetobacter vaccinii]